VQALKKEQLTAKNVRILSRADCRKSDTFTTRDNLCAILIQKASPVPNRQAFCRCL